MKIKTCSHFVWGYLYECMLININISFHFLDPLQQATRTCILTTACSQRPTGLSCRNTQSIANRRAANNGVVIKKSRFYKFVDLLNEYTYCFRNKWTDLNRYWENLQWKPSKSLMHSEIISNKETNSALS